MRTETVQGDSLSRPDTVSASKASGPSSVTAVTVKTQIKDGVQPPRSCSRCLWPAELLNARPVEGGRIAEVAVVQLGDINFHRVRQFYKALGLLSVTVLLSQSLIIRVH